MTTTPIRDDGEDKRPVDAEWPSPTSLEVPVWVLACVRLLPPEGRGSNIDKVLTVAAALSADRVKTSAEESVPLTRDTIGKVAGYSGKQAGKKASWIVDYLIQIGFLRIYRRHLAQNGHRVGDRLTVHPLGRADYAGPRSYAELYQALDGGAWTWDDVFPEPVGSESGTLDDSPRFQGENLGSETAGQPLGSESGTLDDSPRFQGENLGSETAGQPLGSNVVTLASRLSRERNDLFEISEGEISKKKSATPPRSAGAGDAAPENDWARQLVRALPWRERDVVPTTHQAQQLAERFRAAVAKHGWTAEEVQDYALDRLSHAESNPISYVLGAFAPSRLPQEGFAAEPLSENPLPLPGRSKPKKTPEKPAGGKKGSPGEDGVDVTPEAPQGHSEGVSGPRVLTEEERAASNAAKDRVLAEHKKRNLQAQARRIAGR